MATDLFTPILNDRTRAPYFFNGRLLTGEVMSAEQRAQQVAHQILAHGLGDGVAYGMEVLLSHDFNTIDSPVVTIKAGAAVNRQGDLLFLADDVDVQLVRPVKGAAAPQKIFDACKPPQKGVYVTDAGVYLLTVAPITVGDQLAPVSGLGGGGSCNVKYRVNAVEFRLVQLPVDSAVLADTARLRNRVAYACFGVEPSFALARDPVGTVAKSSTLLDALEGISIGECDVPLAVLHWSATQGIRFIDMWAVRRRLTRSRVATAFSPFSDKRLAATEAMVLQFHEHLASLSARIGQAAAVVATTHFRYLPPVGCLPIATTSFPGIVVADFFSNLTVGTQAFFEGSRLQTVIQEALAYFPIDLASKELIWLYEIRENGEAIDKGGQNAPASGMVFVSGHVPYRGDAHFDVAKWDYSNYL